MKKDVIIALDFPGGAQVFDFLEGFGAARPFVKVGMELFYAEGPDIVRRLKARGHKVFLDLKLHDIPNTVGSAMRVLSNLGADMVNLHAQGGSAMMKAAKEGLTKPDGTRPILLAVTVLTSIGESVLNDELHVPGTVAQAVAQYAKNAQNAGLDGVVCSPLEAKLVKEVCGGDFLTVTPGVRLADNDAGDQARVTTPALARAGSDFIVVGRPITRASDPAAAYARCVNEFCGEGNA